jgi:hypothetical protein
MSAWAYVRPWPWRAAAGPLVLLAVVGLGCGNSLQSNQGTGGGAPVCMWENLCVCQCGGAPKAHITLDACDMANGQPCVPAQGGSGGGTNEGGATGGSGAGGGTTYANCNLDHRVCVTP